MFGSTGTGCIALIVVRCRCCCSSSIDHGAELPSSSSSPVAVAIIDTAFHHTPNQKTTHTKQFAYSQVYIKCNKQTAKHSHLIMHIACPLRATGAHSAYYTNALVRCIYALHTSRHNARAPWPNTQRCLTKEAGWVGRGRGNLGDPRWGWLAFGNPLCNCVREHCANQHTERAGDGLHINALFAHAHGRRNGRRIVSVRVPARVGFI